MRNSIKLANSRVKCAMANLMAVSFFIFFPIGVFGQSKPIPKDEIYDAIINNTPKRGIYKHYYEFLANAPSITDSFYVKKTPRPYYLWQDTYALEPRYVQKNKKVRKV